MKKTVLALALVLLVGLVTLVARTGRRPEPRRDLLLERAAIEARANCEAARLIGPSPPRVLLGTDELELALRASPAFEANPVEHVRLVLATRLVRHLARALERGEGLKRLEEERFTQEDLRFLLGALESRVAEALDVTPWSRPEDYDRAQLREFRGLRFDEGLRVLFE
jgi:hypothetical protein